MSLLRRWRALIHKDAMEHELDEEMQYHLERDIEQKIKSGMSPEDARYAALKSFGGFDQSKEECRNARGVTFVEDILRDVTYSIRVLSKSYAFTVVVIVTLALGIGANTAIFSFANGILLRPLPYPRADRLVAIDETALKRGIDSMSVSFPNFLDWREQNKVFQDIGVYYGTSRFSLSGAGEPIEIRGSYISHGLIELLGISPQIGRTFTANEDRPDEDTVVILGYDLWQRNFGGDPNILGRSIMINSRARTVIGVMPRGFRFPEVSEIWAPLAVTTKDFTRTDHGLSCIARLKDGVGLGEAQAEMHTIAARIEAQNPVTNEGLGLKVTSLHQSLAGDYREALLILLGVVGCVLLVACVNVANLMLARASARQKEFALRAAIGAGRWRIMRQLLIESLLLAGAGGALGFAISLWALHLLLTAIPFELPVWMNFGIDLRVLGFSAAITLLTGLLFGAAPALQTSKVDLNDTLKEGGRGTVGGRGRSRSALVVTEIALSLILLVGAGLMILAGVVFAICESYPVLLVAAFIGYKLLSRGSGSSGGYIGVSDLNIREYLLNSNALGSNTYRIEGIIDGRLDNWPSSKGRLFSVLVQDGDDEAPLPVLVPSKFNGTNIQRGQRYRFKVEVQAGTGILQVQDLSKS